MQETNLTELLEATDQHENEKEPDGEANDTEQSITHSTKKPISSLDDLAFVRLLDPIHIPSYLVEQIKGRHYDTEKFYSYQKIACILHTDHGPQLNPTNFLYALVNSKLRQVKGFLWMVADILTNTLVIQNFSVDKEYWHRGESIDLAITKAKKVMKDLHLSRIVWITKNPRFCEDKGYKRSKESIMVFEE